MAHVFIGSEAIASGALTRGQLRWNYRAMFPDVYVAKSATPQLADHVVGAWLWSQRRGVIAGVAAAMIHGANRFDEAAKVELIWRCARPPRGIIVRNERIRSDEIVDIDGIPVTTPERTALDLARYLPRDAAVSHLDALANVAGISTPDVLPLVDRYPGARGLRQAYVALSLMDGGSSSAWQSQLRLALVDCGLPAPKTHIRVTDGIATAFVDMGYEKPMVGVVCGGRPPELLERMGWSIVHAPGTHRPRFTVLQVRTEIRRRGYLPSTLHSGP